MLHVVLDTSVYISSLLQKQGVPAQVLDAWRARRFQIVTSPAIVREIRSTMTYPRIRRRYQISDADIEEFLHLLETKTIFVAGVAEIGEVPLRDPKDVIILACAADAGAHLLVSSDKDLLVLESFNGAPIVTPRQFLDEYLPSAPDSEV